MAAVAVTGPGGRVGDTVLEALSDDHELTPIDKRQLEGWDTTVLDITDAEEIESALAGRDCVVHLAAESGASATWEEVRGPNIDGTWNVFRAAAAQDLDRVVFASSNHVTHMQNTTDPAEPLSQPAATETRAVSPSDPVRPTGPYGISKVTGEAIGCYHADRFDIDVVNLRIGWVLDRDTLRERQEGEYAEYARAMWLSRRDLRDGVRKAVTAPLDRNPLTVNLLSANQERYLSIVETMRTLGYRPEDDSAVELGEHSPSRGAGRQ